MGIGPENVKTLTGLTTATPRPQEFLTKLGEKYYFSQKIVSTSFLKKTFTIFIKLNFFLPDLRFKIYSSPKQPYFNTLGGPIGVGMLGNIFRFWHTFYIFLTNLLYFRLPILYFTNNFFKKEALALN
jgi:hypothetical protein